jgi:hypothetical protein
MEILYRRITENSDIIDIGDAWAGVDSDGEFLWVQPKKDNELWIVAFVTKWMMSGDVTEFGWNYLDTFPVKDEVRKEKIKRDSDNIKSRLEEVITTSKKISLSIAENTSLVKELISGCHHFSSDEINRPFRDKRLFPPNEFRSNPEEFASVIRFSKRLTAIDDISKPTLKITIDVSEANRDKYKAYGFDVDSLVSSFREKLNPKEKEALDIVNHLLEGSMGRTAIHTLSSSEFVKFIDGPEPSTSGVSGLDYELKYFEKQFYQDYSKAQQNVLKLSDDVHPGLDLFDLSCINYYTFHFAAFQKILYGKDKEFLKKLTSIPFKAYFTGLYRAIEKIPPDTEQKKFNRFVLLDSSALSEHKEGSVQVWDAFSSFTSNESKTDISYNTRFEIENDNKSFKSINTISEYPDYNEYLVGPPTKVKVLSVRKIDDINVIKVKLS